MEHFWPHQERSVSLVCDAIIRGVRRILLTLPTGMGKTAVAGELIRFYLDESRRVVLYTNRRLLVEQTSRVMAAAGHEHGIRAAGHEDRRELLFQIASIQTEVVRVLQKGRWGLHEAEFVCVDEAHLHQGARVREILETHWRAGAVILGLTATPIGLGGMYDELIVGGCNSEGRACGALVPAHHFAPDSPDLRDVGWVETGEDLTEKQNVKAIMRAGVFGRVLEWYDRLNPAQAPTLLFAPGVRESAWFADQFSTPSRREGRFQGFPPYRAAHIDGQEIFLDGEWLPTGRNARQDVLEQFRAGAIKVLCSRFVLREGVDCPEIGHMILATCFGSLQSYLQSVGRGLRAAADKSQVTIQDHGDNYLRHGSANADRVWSLDLTPAVVAGVREDRLRAKRCVRCHAPVRPGRPLCLRCGQNNEVEPTRCPKCSLILFGDACPRCREAVDPLRKMRVVVQSDGSLREVRGDGFPPRRIYKKMGGKELWKKMYFRSCTERGDRTFKAAMALFARENHWHWPSTDWPWMPTRETDFYRRVADVPRDLLVSE